MAGIYNGPPRGGTRGGRDQFNWENVKADKDREYYLGASVKALTGRWQKGKDVYWYTRDKADKGEAAAKAREQELAAIKQREEQLMMEALGLKPQKSQKSAGMQPRLDTEDMAKLLGGGEDQSVQPPGEGGDWEGRMGGLGFDRRGGRIDQRQYGIGMEREVLNGEEPEAQQQYRDRDRDRKKHEGQRRRKDRGQKERSRSRSPAPHRHRYHERSTHRRYDSSKGGDRRSRMR